MTDLFFSPLLTIIYLVGQVKNLDLITAVGSKDNLLLILCMDFFGVFLLRMCMLAYKNRKISGTRELVRFYVGQRTRFLGKRYQTWSD